MMNQDTELARSFEASNILRASIHGFYWANAACGWSLQGFNLADSLDASFEATFETRLYDYWYLSLPADPNGWSFNRWYHETPCTSGVFMSEAAAHAWAKANLDGGPYEVKFSELT